MLENTKIQRMSYLKKLSFFSVILLAVKLITLPFIHAIDADAVSRTYIALQFASNPHIISTGNWPPVYFYILGGALRIYRNQLITPIIVNIVLSIVLLFPLFNLLKRMFNDEISFLLCIFFSFSPIIFRLSLLGMSEIPYLFFVILSISILLKGFSDKKLFLIFVAGLLMSVASGIRYESWLIGAVVTIFIFYYKSYKEALLFALPFISFPLYWLLSNYINTNDFFNSFNWAIDIPKTNSINSLDSLLRRIWWYPLSLMFAFGPIAFYFWIIEIKNIKTKLHKADLFLIIFFVLFFMVWLVNALRGNLLLQHRFTITLFLFSFPFIGYYFQRKKTHLLRRTLIFSISAFLLAFGYSSKGARPIPRLLTKDAQIVSRIINKDINEKFGLICDFWNWETTYYIPFSTQLPRENIRIIQSNDNKEIIIRKVLNLINKRKSGILLINKKGKLNSILEKKGRLLIMLQTGIRLEIKTIFENKSIICYKYKQLIT